MRAMLCVLLALVLAAGPAGSLPVSFGGMGADLPVGWQVIESGAETFAASGGDAGGLIGVFQATWRPPDAYDCAAALIESVMENLGAEGDVVLYPVDEQEAAIAEIRFRAGTRSLQGYLVCVDGRSADVALVAYADALAYEAQLDMLLSALDSVQLDGGPARPGPISQFLWPYLAPPTHQEVVAFEGSRVTIRYTPEELDAVRALIEREARILVAYTDHPERDEAWRRYYRLIYRDSRPRLEPMARALAPLAAGPSGSVEEAQAILGWLQGFRYERTGSLSDLRSPLESLVTRSGDCDARSLALILLLSHLGTDGVLLVSSVYSHAVAAVAVNTPGLGLMVEGRKYVLAETTKRVPLGWLDQGQQDLRNWVVVRFDDPAR